MILGNPIKYNEKYMLVNHGFAGKLRLMPMFNRQNSEDEIFTIQLA